jgi:hypothetical protein
MAGERGRISVEDRTEGLTGRRAPATLMNPARKGYMHRYDEEEEHTAPYGWEEVPGTDLSPLGAALAVVGYYIGRGLLIGGVVCFVVVGMLLAAGVTP